MSESVPPTIDARHLLAFLGNAPFFYGKTLAAEENSVVDVEFDEDAQQIEGTVTESGEEYAPMIQVRLDNEEWKIDSCECTCDAPGICSHIAALAIISNKIASQPRTLPAQEEKLNTVWSQQIDSWFEESEPGPADGLLGSQHDAVVPMALQFLLFDSKDTTQQQQWMPTGTIPHPTRNKRFRLGVRPMVRNTEGRWVRGQLRWTTLGFKTYGWNLLRAQHHWFTRFASMARSDTQLQFKVDEDWLFLDEYASDLLWPLLEQADELGIPLITTRNEQRVRIVDPASFSMRASLNEQHLQLDGVLHIANQDLVLEPEAPSGVIAEHGFYAQLAQPDEIWLAPSLEPIPDAHRRWYVDRRPVTVPKSEINNFFESSYPRLARRFELRSTSEELELPVLNPPYVQVTVAYKREFNEKDEPNDTASVDFEIRYPGIPSDQEVYDFEAEELLRSAVHEVFEAHEEGGNPSLSPKFYARDDTIDFVTEILPELEQLPGIKLFENGSRPTFRQLRELPQLKINAVNHERTDWLDLGLLITVGNHEVPFAQIVEAMSNGRMKLRLPDNTWFSLNHPMFAKLKALVDEAQAMNDKPKEGDLKLTVFQISLFEELDEMAEGIDGADLFIARMRSLLKVAEAHHAEVPDTLNAQLRPYQVEGFHWLSRLYEGGFGGILADDMGLGKTLQTIALILHAHKLWADPQACAQLPATQRTQLPFLVVAPSSVVSNWEMEINKFAPSLRVVSVEGTLPSARKLQELAENYDVILTTYTLLRLNDEIYEAQRFAGLILDEAQFVKNKSTKAHRTAVNLQTNFKLAVTGTPMENNLSELGALLSLVAPALFLNTTRFNRQFARPIEVLGDRDVLALLQRRIKPFMLRRTKESVVLDLPAKQEQQVLVRLSEEHQHVYDTHLNRERQKILHLVEDLDRNRFTIFQSLTHLRMLALEPSLVDPELSDVTGSKLEALFDQLDDVVGEGHRALIFSQFTSYLKVLADKLTERGVKFVYLDGNTRNRAKVIEQFKEGEAPLFLISLKAGGFGLNLTEADYCFLLDPWWNPAVEAQAIDRTHRIGQTRQVMVYRMISQGTIEEKVVALQESKRKLISTVMDEADGFSKALTAQDIRGLLE
ncbi:DEAD/DEAH box helicase [Glutamicibacter arilaitensis]|uniref:SNF2 family helicase n=1 Tax=Glutamicibacter arilaitensis TaxID=256701 RepID=A0A2N7RZA6_9MICC|nr:DEAD/DEAH box helicase [Glutamicibacter arilaitensis]PMQ19226.1 SNF2 family helicase [Glutamicibacter arilaitensis]